MFTQDEINSQTPAMQAYMNLKNQVPDKILFYRLGDFYEMFYNDAIEASKILNITLTKKGKDANAIPMAGVPFHSIDNHIQKILKVGKSVAIAEQVGEATPGKGIMERKIARIVTPGTVIDSTLLDPKETKLLCSLYLRGSDVEFAWVDFSSGEIWAYKTPLSKTKDFLFKIAPAEIIIAQGQQNVFPLPSNVPLSIVKDRDYELAFATTSMEFIWGKGYLERFNLPDENATSTIISLMKYLKSTQGTEIKHIQNIQWFSDEEFLEVDTNSKKHLEIIEGYKNHNLWDTLDRCATPMGSRMLKKWLNNPIKDLKTLEKRLDSVEFLKNHSKPYNAWKEFASQWSDIERIAAKIALRTVKPRELTALRDTLRTMPQALSWAEQMPSELKTQFLQAIPNTSLTTLLEKTLLEEPSVWVRDGDIIANGVSQELDELRQMQQGHDTFLQKFEDEEKEKYKIPTLKVDFNSAQGFFISISNSHIDKIPEHYIRKQTLKNAERYTTEELKAYEDKALSAKEKALNIEKNLYSDLLDLLEEYVDGLQKQSKALAQWDVLNALAEVADEQGYCRPTFNKNGVITMVEGKHPVVSMYNKEFIPNSLELKPSENVAIITGPNMGGKSTIMRQLALLTIMAHIGSFVPAKAFSVPSLDAIFTRIGASDDIANGKSTFMVEMSESAYILKNSTSKSLVLLDELGRGTATYDGLSLAWSIAKHLAQKTKAYTLFATHYLEMTDLTHELPNVKNYRVGANESEAGIQFTYQIESGSASRSYGIHVAQLAGVEAEVIDDAKAKLQELENKHPDTAKKDSTVQNHSINENEVSTRTDLQLLKDEIIGMNLDNMSASKALDWLMRKQQELINKY